MICIIALVVFAVLGVFSVRYRPLAREAFDCVFRRITLRKCESGLDKRIKGQLTGKVMKRNPLTARWLYRHFELLSWIFIIVLVVSLGYSGVSLYNFALYGNCNGKTNGEGFCLFDPQGHGKFSTAETGYAEGIVFPEPGENPSVGTPGAPITIIEFGCYRCPYTARAEPVVKQILETYPDEVYYVFRDFPLEESHVGADLHAEAANCALDQGTYGPYRDLLFARQTTMLNHGHDGLIALAEEVPGIDLDVFEDCLRSRKYRDDVLQDFEDGVKAGVYGTPTFFINNRTLVGPQPFDEFQDIIEDELAKN